MTARPDCRPRRLVVLLLLLNAAAVTDRMVVAALAPVLQPALGLGDVQLGLVQGPAFGLAYGLALPFAGRLVDAFGGRRILVWSVLTWTVGLVVSALAANLATLVVGRAITGIGQAALTPAALTLIMAGIGRDATGRAIGLFTGAGTVGRGVAFAVGGALLGLYGGIDGLAPWSAVLLTLAAGNLVMLAAIPFVAVPGSRRAETRSGYARLGRWLRRSPMAVAATVVAALATVVVAQALAAWVAVVLVRRFALPPATAAIAIGAIGLVAGPAGHLLGGAIADRRGWHVRGQAAASLLCLPAILVFVHAPGTASAYAALAATMLASGAAATLGLIRLQRMFPPDARGTANGLFMALVAVVGISGGPALVPLMGSDIGLGLAVVVGGAALVAALAAALAPAHAEGAGT